MNRKDKLYLMLKYMSDYSIEQPKEIEKLCNDLFLTVSYAPVMDLMVEAFLTVHAFKILMFEGLISSASAILRILIEQVSILTVVCRNEKALNEYLIFQGWKRKSYGLNKEEYKQFLDFIKNESGFKSSNKIKEFLDYGWIRVINNDRSGSLNRVVIKEAHLEEVINDLNNHLNAFAHGQRSMFEYLKDKNLGDKHVSRIIMITGKLFLLLCHDKHELLENKSFSSTNYYDIYLHANILYLDLNARSINERIIDIVQNTEDLDRDIILHMSVLEHERGLIYSSELDYIQVNSVAKAYSLDLINETFMLLFKKYSSKFINIFDGVETVNNLVAKIGLREVEKEYLNIPHKLSLNHVFEMAQNIPENWGLMNNDGSFEELDEIFLTDYTSFVHVLFDELYSNKSIEEIMASFVPID